MKSRVLIVLLLLMSSQVYASSYAVGKVKRFYVGSDGWVLMGLVTQPANTCHYFGEYFKFNGVTAEGKNMLSVIMAAKMADKIVNVWYTDSPNSGTSETNGCSLNSLSTLTNIGIQ